MKPHQQQFIGKTITIITSNNKTFVGKTGIIEDETKNTITIQGKKIPKKQIIFNINGKIIDGKTITKTITERIKVHKT